MAFTRYTGRGGWFAYVDPDVMPTPIYIRVRDDDGRLVIASVLLEDDDEPLTSTRLRQVPLGRIEGALSGQTAEALRKGLHRTQGDPLRDLRALVEDSESREPIPQEELEALGRPVPGSDGDEFYARVALAYMTLASLSRKPAVLLAEQSGVPVGTVHRWIREARRRGILGPGRKGKVG